MGQIQFIGACIGYTVSALTLISLIIKPIRTKIVNRIKGINQTDSTIEALKHIDVRLDKVEERLDEIAEGTQASLRNNILQLVDSLIAHIAHTSYASEYNQINYYIKKMDDLVCYHNSIV